MLAHTLLPLPDQYVIVDRQRASANGFLVAPPAQRNYHRPCSTSCRAYMFVPKSARASWKSLAKYRNVSPARFGIDRNATPGTTFPLYTLFSPGPVREHHEWRLDHQDDLGRRPDDRHRVYPAGSQLYAAGLVFGHDHHANGFYVGGDTARPRVRPRPRRHGIEPDNRDHDRGWVHDRGGCNHNGYWVDDRGDDDHGGYWVGREFDHGNRHGFLSSTTQSAILTSYLTWPRPRIRTSL